MLRRSGRAGLAIALVVSLTACVETTRLPAAEPSPSVAPLFASDEEALAAATEAYEEFLLVSGEILRDGGADPERLRPIVSEEVYLSELEGFETMSQNGWRATGQTSLEHVLLQQYSAIGTEAEVIIYVCTSIVDTDVVDAAGNSQVDRNRRTQLGFEVVLASRDGLPLVVERKTQWVAESTCQP